MKNYLKPISLFKQTNFSNTIWWKLKINISGYQNKTGNDLVTEIFKNRIFRLIYPRLYSTNKKHARILVQFFEDGYICWIDLDKLVIEKYNFKNHLYLDNYESSIQDRIPSIINWIEDQSNLQNHYLWGGTLGPNFDCSGLIQTAFFIHNIYIPRDSYQIKSFCKHLFNFKSNNYYLKKGDILFFGNNQQCNHVAIYAGDGYYYHSSGIDYGRNGIGKDTLKDTNDKISLHYKSQLLSAGRVTRSLKWDRTIR